MSTIPGLYVIGEANFSDHGANRLGASALMQGLADGYFILPNTIGDYLASSQAGRVDTSHPEFRLVEAEVAGSRRRFLGIKGKRTVDSFHRELGKMHVGQVRHGARREGSRRSARADSAAARGVLARRERARQRRGAESGAGEGGPRGRLPRARRADVPRRAAPRRVVRRTFPRGAPDRGRRGPARRRALRLRRRPGSIAGPTGPRGCTRSRWPSRPCTWRRRSYK